MTTPLTDEQVEHPWAPVDDQLVLDAAESDAQLELFEVAS